MVGKEDADNHTYVMKMIKVYRIYLMDNNFAKMYFTNIIINSSQGSTINWTDHCSTLKISTCFLVSPLTLHTSREPCMVLNFLNYEVDNYQSKI